MNPTREPLAAAAEPARSQGPIPIPQAVLNGLRYALIACSVLLVVLFLFSAKARLSFAFEYDWIEDGVLASMRHIRAGLPLYERPTLGYTPFIYTPLYLYLAAFVSRFTGDTYAPMRLVSMFATLGCFGAIYGLVFQETRRHFAAIAAVGCFAACYTRVHEWFDIGRVDMLSVFFLICAVWVTRKGSPALAALLWVCSFQTKQGVLPVAILLLCHDWRRPRRVVEGVGTFALAMAASILWLDHASHGWYRFYIFGLGGALRLDLGRAAHFPTADLLSVYGGAFLVIVATFFLAPPTLRSRATSFYAIGTGGLFAFSWFIRAHEGSGYNSLLPLYAWIAILFGLALGRINGLLGSSENPLARPILALLLVSAMAQLVIYVYSPRVYTPDAAFVASRQAFEAQLRAIPGDVLLLNFPEYGVQAGKPTHATDEATGLVMDKYGPEGQRLLAEYQQQIHEHRYAGIVLDRRAEDYFIWEHALIQHDFLVYYPLKVAAVGQNVQFGNQPAWIYLPCSAVETARKLDASVDVKACSLPQG